MKRILTGLLLCFLCASMAYGAGRDRIIATGGVSTIEGTAGGGIVPMAVIAGYGTREQVGATAFASTVITPDYELYTAGGSWSWHNRIEVSVAEQQLNHYALSKALGVANTHIRQSIVGVKVRVAGDLLYTAMPQVSIGAQYKKNHDFFIPAAAGALRDNDTDFYLSASKVLLGGFFGYNWLINTTARYTRANQTGLVGFGGDKNASRELMAELSTGVFYNKHWLMGAEYKQKPDNLSFAQEDDWQTAFVAWFPNKTFAVTAAYVNLGELATFAHQRGWYLSVQGSF